MVVRVEIKMEDGDKLESVIWRAVEVANKFGERVWFSFDGKEVYADPGEPLWMIGRRVQDVARSA